MTKKEERPQESEASPAAETSRSGLLLNSEYNKIQSKVSLRVYVFTMIALFPGMERLQQLM